MSNETKTLGGVGTQQGFGAAVPIQRPMLASVGQAAPADAVVATPSAPPATVDPGVPFYPEPSWSDLLIDASLATIKAGAAGAVVGAALSAPGKRSRAIVRGATVSATVSPIAVGILDIARIHIRDSSAEQKAAERRAVLKTSGIALALGAALLGIDYALTRAG